MTALAPATSPGAASDSLADLHLRREHLIDLYTDCDINRATFRNRQAKLDEQIRVAEIERQSSAASAVPVIPATFDELVELWNESGIDFQRELLDVLVTSITVRPATTIRRRFDAGRLEVHLRA